MDDINSPDLSINFVRQRNEDLGKSMNRNSGSLKKLFPRKENFLRHEIKENPGNRMSKLKRNKTLIILGVIISFLASFQMLKNQDEVEQLKEIMEKSVVVEKFVCPTTGSKVSNCCCPETCNDALLDQAIGPYTKHGSPQGVFTCRMRMNFLMEEYGDSQRDACLQAIRSFPLCGNGCTPGNCLPPTIIEKPFQENKQTKKKKPKRNAITQSCPPESDLEVSNCCCPETCNDSILDQEIGQSEERGSLTCRMMINSLMSNGGDPQREACEYVANQFSNLRKWM